MAKKKNSREDELLSMVWTLVSELKSMKTEMEELKNKTLSSSKAEEWEVLELRDKNELLEEIQKAAEKRETPYKVIPIQSIIRDESYMDPSLQWIKKIYMWMWRTFKNKEEATKYLDRMKESNPWIQYDIFPV